MPLIEVVKPTRKVIPDPIIATKVSKEVQESFDQLAEKTYHVTRAELLRLVFMIVLSVTSRSSGLTQ